MEDIIHKKSPTVEKAADSNLQTRCDKHSAENSKRYRVPTAIELCCGSANWSAAHRALGIEAIGLDFERNPQKPTAPVVLINLATTEGQARFSALDEQTQFDILHAAPPCGTASRARERQLPLALIRQGIPTPRQLRSNQYPLGLPGLTQHEEMRVRLANLVYNFVLQTCIDRHMAGRLFSLENPVNSYFWQIPLAIILMTLTGVRITEFPQCIHGGKRPVIRRWVSNIPEMDTLEGVCPGVSAAHEHSPFGASKQAGTWKFATAEEATYPPVLCKKVAKISAAALEAKGLSLKPVDLSHSLQEPIARRLGTRAAGGLFVRGNKLPQMISEFKCTEQFEVKTSTLVGSVVSMPNGNKAKVLRFTGVQTGELRMAAVGIYRNPEQFVDAAWESRHPIDMPSYIPEILIRNIFWLLTTPETEIKEFRLSAIRSMRLKASELADANDQIHNSLSKESAKVLSGKQFALMDWAIKEASYADTGIVKDMVSGTPLTGTVAQSNIFPQRIIPASVDAEDLIKASKTTRREIINKIKSSGDPEIDLAVFEETKLEVKKGWLSEPMTEQQVSNVLGDLFTVARRFGIRQSSKIRTIDDYSEPGVNATVQTTERIDLYGTDEVFIMMKLVASAVRDDGTVFIRLADGSQLLGRIPPGTSPARARSWLGKTYDLKSAYRQMATSDSNNNRRFCVIGVYNPLDGTRQLHIQYGSPFGSVSVVYYFNRAARALWALGAHFLRLSWTNYFDDYPIIDPCETSTNCDMAVKSFFSLMGWSLSSDDKKTKPFSPEFQLLGIVADMSKLPDGTAIFRNKPERVEEICSSIEVIIKSKRCPQPTMSSLRGRCQYAAQQAFGRMAVGPLHVLSQHEHHSKSGILESGTLEALRRIKSILNLSPPRSLNCFGERRPLLLFTDGAAEGELRNYVTCGAVLIDTADSWSQMWGGLVPARVIKAWRADGEKLQVIGQAELLPVALSRRQWRERLRHRRLIVFVDNDSARHALIRGWSPSKSSRMIVQEMLDAELQDQVWIWYARVPTHSNPGDKPSRLVLVPSAENDYADVIPMPSIPESLYPTN